MTFSTITGGKPLGRTLETKASASGNRVQGEGRGSPAVASGCPRTNAGPPAVSKSPVAPSAYPGGCWSGALPRGAVPADRSSCSIRLCRACTASTSAATQMDRSREPPRVDPRPLVRLEGGAAHGQVATQGQDGNSEQQERSRLVHRHPPTRAIRRRTDDYPALPAAYEWLAGLLCRFLHDSGLKGGFASTHARAFAAASANDSAGGGLQPPDYFLAFRAPGIE